MCSVAYDRADGRGTESAPPHRRTVPKNNPDLQEQSEMKTERPGRVMFAALEIKSFPPSARDAK